MSGDVDGMQIGVVHGGIKQVVSGESSPAEKLETGISLLGSFSSERAYELITHAVHRGIRDNRALYYWALSIFAQRSINDIAQEQLGNLSRAKEYAQRDDTPLADELRAVFDILDNCLFPGDDGDVAAKRVNQRLEELPAERRKEVNEQLRSLVEPLWDQEAALAEAEHVRLHRMANDRARRVPKFFMADPTPPVRVAATFRPASVANRVLAVSGFLFALAGALYSLYGMASEAVLIAAMVAVCWGGGIRLAATPSLEWAWYRYSRPRGSHSVPVETAGASEIAESCDPVFVEDLRSRVAKRFTQLRPYANPLGPAPSAYMRQLIDETLLLYGRLGVSANSVDWLIRWHVKEFRRIHEAIDQKTRETFPPMLFARMLSGIALAVAGSVIGLLLGSSLMVIPTAVAAGFLVKNGLPMYLAHRQYGVDQREAAKRYRRQYLAYRDRIEYLRDRPRDSQMAQWLDLDVREFSRMAMRQAELKSGDVVDSVILIEPFEKSANARVMYGPPRFARYRVQLFLLTTNGIRHFAEHLNFVTGRFSRPRRTTFRYDMMVSVRVIEKRSRDGASDPSASATTKTEPGDEYNHLGTTLRIKLAAGKDITIHVPDDETNPLAGPSGQDPEEFSRTARDVTRITGATRVLESVAAEGREWLTIAQRRRAHGLG